VQAHMNNMTAGAQTAAGVMRGIGQIYGEQTQNLSKGVSDAHTQVLSMNKNIDEMQERTDRMRSSLKVQGDDLMGTLRQILTQLEMTGDGLSEAVDRTLQQQAADNLKKMG
jgi:TolA-binding protein